VPLTRGAVWIAAPYAADDTGADDTILVLDRDPIAELGLAHASMLLHGGAYPGVQLPGGRNDTGDRLPTVLLRGLVRLE